MRDAAGGDAAVSIDGGCACTALRQTAVGSMRRQQQPGSCGLHRFCPLCARRYSCSWPAAAAPHRTFKAPSFAPPPVAPPPVAPPPLTPPPAVPLSALPPLVAESYAPVAAVPTAAPQAPLRRSSRLARAVKGECGRVRRHQAGGARGFRRRSAILCQIRRIQNSISQSSV